MFLAACIANIHTSTPLSKPLCELVQSYVAGWSFDLEENVWVYRDVVHDDMGCECWVCYRQVNDLSTFENRFGESDERAAAVYLELCEVLTPLMAKLVLGCDYW